MELDDFRKTIKTLYNGNDRLHSELVENTMDKVRKNFARQKKTAFTYAAVDLCLAIIYAAALRKTEMYYNIGLTLLVAGFVAGSVYIFLKSRLLNDSIYSLPLVSFLEHVEKRLVFMQLYDWLIVIPLLMVIGTGGGLIFFSRLSLYTDNTAMIIITWIAFYTALIVFAFTVSGKDWEKQHGPLLREIRKLRESLDNENNNNRE